MPDYRADVIGADGHFIDAVALNCEDDAAVNTQTVKLVGSAGHDVGLWQGKRLVSNFSQKQQSSG
jgi:hypothetical protein